MEDMEGTGDTKGIGRALRVFRRLRVRRVTPAFGRIGAKCPFIVGIQEGLIVRLACCAALQRFAGTYASTQPPVELRVQAVEGVLVTRLRV
jgi:hypothetical protein